MRLDPFWMALAGLLGTGLLHDCWQPAPSLARAGSTAEIAVSAPAPTQPVLAKPKLRVSIQPQHMTDALRAVILADRAVYMEVLGELERAESFASAREAGGESVPSPCEVLRRGSEGVASRGVEYSYVLRAVQPINPRNRAETEVELKGLQFVGTRPDLVYSAEELLGGRWYFTAVYPDVATSGRCADCHNRQRGSGAAALKSGDVIGALVIRIALEL